MMEKPDTKLPAQSNFEIPDLNISDVQADEDRGFLIRYSDNTTIHTCIDTPLLANLNPPVQRGKKILRMKANYVDFSRYNCSTVAQQSTKLD